MTKGVLTHVVGCARSHDVWSRINSYFAAHMRAKIHQYKYELRNTKKGARTVPQYLLRIKALMDSLVSIGSPVSEQEHVEIILEGLPSEYDAFSTAPRTRKEEYTVSEVESLLLAQEVRTDPSISKPTLSDALSANIANMNNKENPNSGERNTNNNQFNTNQNQRGNYQQNIGGRRGFGINRGRGRFQGNRYSVVCQVCFKPGHVASHCFHRFDHSFQPTFSSFSNQPYSNSS